MRRLWWNLTNLYCWLPVLWNCHDWDQSFLWRIMEFKLRHMADYHEHHGHLVSNARNAREMRVAAALLRRMQDSNYIFVQGRTPQDWEPAMPFGELGYHARLKERIAGDQRDLDYLCAYLRRKAPGWWD